MAGLYIHIPFCAQRCAYCDFYKSTDTARMAVVLEALEREMSARRGFLPGGRLDTIYVGGGTPSLVPPERLQSLIDHAAALWDCTDLKEVTLEANPEDLTCGYLEKLRSADTSLSLRPVRNDGYECHSERGAAAPTRDLPDRFNRLSIGIQSFDDGLLKLMNRRHDAARAKQAVRAAQRAGFDNITIDLIYGIPGMSPAQWERTLDEAIALGVQHISAYHLTIEPGTAFGRMAEAWSEVAVSANSEHSESTARTLFNVGSGRMDRGVSGSPTPPAAQAARFEPIPEAESERQYETLRRKLADAGFEHYEISNFALPGRRAVHNGAYWSGGAYLGVGPSAHSFDGAKRREWVCADVEKYIAGAGTGAICEGETLTKTELFNERVMTALRTSDGLDLTETERRFGTERVARLRSRAEKFTAKGLLSIKGGNLAVAPEKFLLSDYIIASLFE